MADNKLFYGDNLEVLRQHIESDSVDLVYLDPPFNSNRNYNVLFGRHETHPADDAAQMQAFGDTWVWTPETEEQYLELIQGGTPNRVADALTAFRTLLGENDAMAYLVNMTPRLVELHRVLKSTGSMYLHCDPTMSHYLKVLLDATFGPTMYRNEITWRRTSTVKGNAGQGARHFGRNTDIILFYTKSDIYTFNPVFQPYSDEYLRKKFSYVEEGTGRRFQTVSMEGPGGAAKGNPLYEVLGVTRYWRFSKPEMERLISEGRVHQAKPGNVPRQKYYLDEAKGVQLQSLWSDIDAINSQAAERLGYPTQKPLALLERILAVSTNPGDTVLDPFCGCGTTVDAAQSLNRKWLGIDVTYIAIDLIRKRLRHTYGEEIEGTYDVLGIPRDRAGAFALFSQSPFDFERWAVSLVNAQPNEKQVGDKGIDGVARFFLDASGKNFGRILVSVKGGKTIGPQFVRDLLGTVETQKAEMGILITMTEPTRGIIDAVNHAGTYTHPANGQKFPKVQVITVDQLLRGEKPNVPLTMLPYIEAKRARLKNTDEGLF
ncbi:DNA methyltransferase [Nocardioides sp. SOB44]|uniref:DNA methyltransferase n=1 Tax=Nocardioides cremeus TaxID=3058044 RepID=A0ABT8TNX5_9ACTN|nr:DNA methyltransferase [Nocardioides cremeus]MDO3394668.1 DNA methyltransferase [Nocardioides cremeus]